MAIKIDFTRIKVYTDITRTESSVIDARVRVADDLYRNGQGIAFIKTFADGKQYCILIDKYEDGELSPKTGYKKPLRGLNGFYSVHDRCPAKQSPNLTSVTPKVPRRFVAKITNFFVISK